MHCFEPKCLSAEQILQMREEMLKQAEAKVLNAEANYRMALAALEALRAGGTEK